MRKFFLCALILLFTADAYCGDLKSPSDSIGMGTKAVTTAGTPVALSATSEVAKDLIVKAYSTNTGLIYVGTSAVDKDTKLGGELSSGDVWVIPLCNISETYIDSTVNGEGVTFTYTR